MVIRGMSPVAGVIPGTKGDGCRPIILAPEFYCMTFGDRVPGVVIFSCFINDIHSPRRSEMGQLADNCRVQLYFAIPQNEAVKRARRAQHLGLGCTNARQWPSPTRA